MLDMKSASKVIRKQWKYITSEKTDFDPIQDLLVKICFPSHLDHYMPLIKQRPRAIFDAAPVKQNIPLEVLEELKAQKKHDNVINLLEHFAAKTVESKAVIFDPVIVRPV